MSYEAIKCLARAASFISSNDSSLLGIQQNRATSKKRQAPKASEERSPKRLLAGKNFDSSIRSSLSLSSSSSSTAPSSFASTPRTRVFTVSSAEESQAVESFQACNEAAARKLLNALNSRCRVWATHEWFYSGVDQAYFDRCDFEEALQERGWSHLTTATRTEWGEIRAALGKPRRLSTKFLRRERQTLAQYRTVVRQHQARSGAAPLGSQWLFPIPAAPRVGEVVSVQLRTAHAAKTQAHVTDSSSSSSSSLSSSSSSTSSSSCPPCSSTSHHYYQQHQKLHGEGSRGLLSRGTVLACDVAAGEYCIKFDRPELGRAGHAIVQDSDLCVHGAPPLLHSPPSTKAQQQPIPPSPSFSHSMPCNSSCSVNNDTASVSNRKNDSDDSTAVPTKVIETSAAAAAAAVAAAMAVLSDSSHGPTTTLEDDWGILSHASGGPVETPIAGSTPPLLASAPMPNAQRRLEEQRFRPRKSVSGGGGSLSVDGCFASTCRKNELALPFNADDGSDAISRLSNDAQSHDLPLNEGLGADSRAGFSLPVASAALDPLSSDSLASHEEKDACAEVANHLRTAKLLVKRTQTAWLAGQTHQPTTASTAADEGTVEDDGMPIEAEHSTSISDLSLASSEITGTVEGVVALVLTLADCTSASAPNAASASVGEGTRATEDLNSTETFGSPLQPKDMKCATAEALDRAAPRWLHARQTLTQKIPTQEQPLLTKEEGPENQGQQSLPPPLSARVVLLAAEIASVEEATAEIFNSICSSVGYLTNGNVFC